jgi:hypothetical protein
MPFVMKKILPILSPVIGSNVGWVAAEVDGDGELAQEEGGNEREEREVSEDREEVGDGGRVIPAGSIVPSAVNPAIESYCKLWRSQNGMVQML